MQTEVDKIREKMSDAVCRDLSGLLDEAGKTELQDLEEEWEKVDRTEVLRRLHREREFDHRKAWHDFERKLIPHRQAKAYRLLVRAGMSVAAVLVLALGIWWMAGEKDKMLPPTMAEEVIVPGKSMAVITLASGEKVEVGNCKRKLMEENGTVLKFDSTSVKYQGDGNVRDELIYNTVDIPAGGEYRMALADGSKVWMNADSRLRFPVNFTGKCREVFLEGEAYFEVAKDKEHPFVVHTSRGAIEVLGTGFNVRDYRDEARVVTTLVAGRVLYRSGGASGEAVVLTPGFQLEDCGHGGLVPRQVDVVMYVGWKDGKYIFENSSLEEIMQVLSRWYDVAVFYQNDQVKNLHFTGELERYENIYDFLEFMELGGNVCFTIKGKTIMVE